MAMEYGEAINNAIERTKYLLWERPSRVRWRNFAILSLLCGPGGGGGGGGGGDMSSLFKGSGDKSDTSMRVMLGCSIAGVLSSQAASAESEFGPYLGLIVLLALGLIFFSLAVAFISNFARVILVENIVHDRDAILDPWARLSRLGWSVLWWGVGFCVAMLFAMGVLVGAPAGVIGMMSQSSPGAALLFIPLLFWFLAVLIPLCFVNGYFQEIVIPLMYRQNCTANEAWALFKPMFMAQKMRWIGYMVIHFFLVMAGGIAAGLISLMVLMLVGLVVGLPALGVWLAAGPTAGVIGAVIAGCIFVVACIAVGALLQAPVTVAARSFSMYILQQVAPEYGFLPLGGRPLAVSPVDGMVIESAPSGGAGLNPESAPTSDWSEMPPTHG